MAAMRQPSQDTVSSAESADHGGRAASASGHHHHPTRARRNPIAAQACETCRARKTRCSETRPRCGLCERLDLRCVYREPRPTKKDKTAETLLAAVQRIDGKLDRILEAQQPPPWNEASETLTMPDPMLVDAAAGIQRQQQYRRPSHAPDESELRGALSVFPWPAVKALLVNGDGAATADLQGILAEGSGWLLRHEMLSGPAGALPCDSFLSGSNVHVVRADREQSRIVFPSLTPVIMDRYARAYFASYNLIYPVLDRETAESLKSVLRIERAWDSHGIDMIRRVYWTCNVIESWYYLDLNLPRSDAVGFQDFIALPDFDDHRDFEGDPAIEKKYRYSFLSMVSLRRLIHRAFDELYGRKTRTDGATIADQTLVIAELLHQLDGWRTMLPPELRWDDSARASYASVAADTEAATASSTAPSPVHVDILLAQLRCRYYYARFTILRPYLWRALHAPPGALALGPAAVLDGFVGAVDAMLQWPVAVKHDKQD
ncbi:putative transcription factor [Diplodia seriata]|uniref:Putative transcription factor n=1 Tax=Diplodia seriata TaxID=420778 RepID=A0A0G2ESD2_9PEZI|nr:putative transcription factor [Diplodia seriata]